MQIGQVIRLVLYPNRMTNNTGFNIYLYVVKLGKENTISRLQKGNSQLYKTSSRRHSQQQSVVETVVVKSKKKADNTVATKGS